MVNVIADGALRVNDTLTMHENFAGHGDPLLLTRTKKDRFFVRAFDFDAVRLDSRIIAQSVVNNAPIERVQRFEFHDVSPTPNFFSSFFGLLNKSLARLPTVAADIHGDLRQTRVAPEQNAI